MKIVIMLNIADREKVKNDNDHQRISFSATVPYRTGTLSPINGRVSPFSYCIEEVERNQ